jgi:heme-degrading monooxygenase HmoA
MSAGTMLAAEHVMVWEFQVKAPERARFEHEYGPAGSWAQLFSRAAGYAGTALLRDAADPSRYLTIDRWRSALHYQAFRKEFAEQYAQLDHQCEQLTLRETALGTFTGISEPRP